MSSTYIKKFSSNPKNFSNNSLFTIIKPPLTKSTSDSLLGEYLIPNNSSNPKDIKKISKVPRNLPTDFSSFPSFVKILPPTTPTCSSLSKTEIKFSSEPLLHWASGFKNKIYLPSAAFAPKLQPL